MLDDHGIDPELSKLFDMVINETGGELEDSEMGWIGVDLDGTLAYYDEWRGIDHIGKPVPVMLERVNDWIEEGKTVKIFTARVSSPDFDLAVIHAWLKENGLPALEVTNMKDHMMIECWDDRSVQVETNTGRRVDGQGEVDEEEM